MILATVNQKGGVGKTAITINLGYYLSSLGKRVLIVDADSQHNATNIFLRQSDIEKSIVDLMLDKSNKVNPQECLYKIYDDKSLWLLPSDERLPFEMASIYSRTWREKILKKKLKPIINHYDYILIDCNPSFDVMVQNAIILADRLLIPIDSGSDSLNGLQLLYKVINELTEDSPPPSAIVKSRYNKTMAISNRAIAKGLEGAHHLLCDTVIRQNSDLTNNTHAKKTLFEFNPKSESCEDFRKLAIEIFNVE